MSRSYCRRGRASLLYTPLYALSAGGVGKRLVASSFLLELGPDVQVRGGWGTRCRAIEHALIPTGHDTLLLSCTRRLQKTGAIATPTRTVCSSCPLANQKSMHRDNMEDKVGHTTREKTHCAGLPPSTASLLQTITLSPNTAGEVIWRRGFLWLPLQRNGSPAPNDARNPWIR